MSRWADAALTEWRRYREPRDLSAHLSGIGDALQTLLPKLGLGDALDEQAVRRSWSAIVGEFIAAHAEPEKIRAGILYIRVHQPSVRFELERMWKAGVTDRLSGQFGAHKIRGVKFVS